MPAIPKTASKINETQVQAQTESDIEHGNQFLPKKSDVELRSKYYYSFRISASERPVIRRIKSVEQLSRRISFAVSRFA